MRIISGKLKGKSIDFVKNLQTRPLKDIVRENIFNILKHSNSFNIEIKNSNILDLYSGIGSFGIECISRGARKVTFIEKNKSSSNILKENLNRLSIKEKALVRESDKSLRFNPPLLPNLVSVDIMPDNFTIPIIDFFVMNTL